MKYALTFAFGFLSAMAIYRIPHYPLFNDRPVTPVEWRPKMTGSWTEDEIRTTHGYFNGGVNR